MRSRDVRDTGLPSAPCRTGGHACRLGQLALAVSIVCGLVRPADAQIDPLLAIKRSTVDGGADGDRARVLLVVDTSERMQWGYAARTEAALEDLDLRVSQAQLDDRSRWSYGYYDPRGYTCDGDRFLGALGLSGCPRGLRYRRAYVGLDRAHAHVSEIVATSEAGGAAYSTFFARSRLGAARAALLEAVRSNDVSVRFGLLQTRHRLAAPLAGGTVASAKATPNPEYGQDLVTDDPDSARWTIGRPTGEVDNVDVHEASAPLVRADDPGANAAVVLMLQRDPDAGGLVGAGNDGDSYEDSPLEALLTDARVEAERLIASDDRCRNTVVVLLTGGRERTGGHAPSAESVALGFRNVRGRRVPIHVIGIEPTAGVDGNRAATDAELQAIADASGGRYARISAAEIELAVRAGRPAPGIVRAANEAVQHGHAEPADVNAAPTLHPFGPMTDVQVASPVVGTVNLRAARFADGSLVPDAESHLVSADGTELPQRANLLVTSGFSLPGFGAVLRGFRVYRPVPDASRSSGYAFVTDGTKLWDARLPTTSDGRAVDAARRNIFTALADGTVVPFVESAWSVLRSALRMSADSEREVRQAIHDIRSRPLGPIVSATPAILDPPSLDPPDEEYVGFAETLRRRRTLVFVGANDGMLHAIDGRTGLEVWAFIPFNLLPKLNAIRQGLAVDRFLYTMDGSPTLADVKVGEGERRRWRTYLVAGEGAGGTFYQAFDVTLDALAACVGAEDDATEARLLGCFASPSVIALAWAFPRYAHFDPAAFTWGELGPGATLVEKTVGQTWSSPVVGQVADRNGPWAVLTGSGFLPHGVEQAARGGAAAGTSFYLLGVDDGSVDDWRDVGNDGRGEAVDDCAAGSPDGCRVMKNALQGDPVGAGPPGSRSLSKAYQGDLDGNVWRFDLGTEGGRATFGARPARLFAGGPDQPLIGSIAAVNVGTRQYLYFGSGSDLLASRGTEGGFRLYGLLEGQSTPIFSHELAHGGAGGPDERVSALPAVAGDIVFFSTTTLKPGVPCGRPDASLYAFTFLGGAAYDSTGDGQVEPGESRKVVELASAGRASAPFATDRHLWFGAGTGVSVLGDSRGFNAGAADERVRILSWREVR